MVFKACKRGCDEGVGGGEFDQDLDVLRALGANPTMIAADDLIGVLGALLLGAFLAAAGAVGLSPLALHARV